MHLDGSHGEGTSAAAGLGGVGVGEIEAAADERGAEVQLHSVDVQQAFGITDHFKAGSIWCFVLVSLIVVLDVCRRDEIHRVAHAAAASRAHAHPQNLLTSLVAAKSGQLLHGRPCNQDALSVSCGMRLTGCRGLSCGFDAGHRRHWHWILRSLYEPFACSA